MGKNVVDGKDIIARDLQCRFGYWWERLDQDRIREAGLLVPKTVVFQMDGEVTQAIWKGEHTAEDEAERFISESVLPVLKDAGIQGSLFIKNATFSNKFDANNACLAHSWDLTEHMLNIMCDAMERMMGYDGCDELVVREFIRYDKRKTGCIYNGLPFRPEYRVFYDFDKGEAIFVIDYWLKEEVRGHLYNRTDQAVYDACYPEIRETYEKNCESVKKMVEQAMKGAKLEGCWSVDVMQEGSRFYLIDMAVAELSCYWNYRPGNEDALASERRAREEQKQRLEKQSDLLVSKGDTAVEEELKKIGGNEK